MGQPYNEILFNSKTNEVLIHATIWMNLNNAVPSERSQHKNYILYNYISTKLIQKKKLYRLKADQRLPGSGGGNELQTQRKSLE